jgi:hypothetical protein
MPLVVALIKRWKPLTAVAYAATCTAVGGPREMSVRIEAVPIARARARESRSCPRGAGLYVSRPSAGERPKGGSRPRGTGTAANWLLKSEVMLSTTGMNSGFVVTPSPATRDGCAAPGASVVRATREPPTCPSPARFPHASALVRDETL